MKQILGAAVAAPLADSAIQGEEAAVIEGQMSLAQTGGPVAGATVTLLATGASTTAGRQGEFQFKGVRPGSYRLDTSLEGAWQEVAHTISVAPEGKARAQVFSTQQRQSIPPASGGHAETFNPLSLLRLGVVEGLATSLYGSAALRGVVNAVSGRAGFISRTDGLQGYLHDLAGAGNASADTKRFG